ncbi:hypothetical protein CCACVL1_28328 [Corchorus capsularis]|uniref:Uncharacterized protein n=1 Tax=Corchorus capsularis TaxID=210143 RepID=A0A1R3G6U4_COCAP|nr:hypothetical protein CCACVL1_28328 [Corchorus capsularis]
MKIPPCFPNLISLKISIPPPAHVTNQFSLDTQSDDADQNSLFSESEFPASDSEVPFESQEFPMEIESHTEKRSPLPSPPPPKKAPSPWRSDATKATEYVNHCYKKCVKKQF